MNKLWVIKWKLNIEGNDIELCKVEYKRNCIMYGEFMGNEMKLGWSNEVVKLLLLFIRVFE